MEWSCLETSSAPTEAFVAHATHSNAALTPRARLRLALLIVDHGWPLARAAERYDVSWKTAKKWAERYAAEGPVGMADRSSRPHHQPNRTPVPVVRKIVHLRWKQRLGPVEIADRLNMPSSTVHAVLVRCGINRLSHIDRATGEPIRRYEHERPGDLIHVDVKKLGKVPDGGGWRYVGRQQGKKNRSTTAVRTAGRGNLHGNPLIGTCYLHTVIDDQSRVAYVEARCPASRRWQELWLGKGGGCRVGEALVNIVRAVPGDRLVRPDGVELDSEGLGLADQVEGVVDGFEVEPVVLQRLEAAFSDAVLARAVDLGPDVGQRRLAGDEGAEAERLERATVVGDQRDGRLDLPGVGVDRAEVDQRVAEQPLGLGDSDFDRGDRVELVGGRGPVPAELVGGPVVGDPRHPPGAALGRLALGEVELPHLVRGRRRFGERSTPLLGQLTTFALVVGLE
ncbi:MAG: helix-turn-helix domain-containing protein [Nocardioidaceae bacterium]|nr:helix-turn-helix domain-containing protein [Nocardioidaceae bacterium]